MRKMKSLLALLVVGAVFYACNEQDVKPEDMENGSVVPQDVAKRFNIKTKAEYYEVINSKLDDFYSSRGFILQDKKWVLKKWTKLHFPRKTMLHS
jgi:hypothetical protein